LPVTGAAVDREARVARRRVVDDAVAVVVASVAGDVELLRIGLARAALGERRRSRVAPCVARVEAAP
jgi:hypothetical protein